MPSNITFHWGAPFFSFSFFFFLVRTTPAAGDPAQGGGVRLVPQLQKQAMILMPKACSLRILIMSHVDASRQWMKSDCVDCRTVVIPTTPFN